MNLALILQFFTVLFLSELIVTAVGTVFFTSLFSRPKVQINFQPPETKQKPHIIIILADDLGWNDVSFHGSDQIPTPNIDALAYNGIILNNHYVPALCTPSRSALMTGKNPIHLGMQHSVLYPTEPRGLPLSEKLLPQYLQEIGYKTHAVGKWHLGYFKKQYTPTYRGFDSHFGYWNGLEDYYTHIAQEPDPLYNEYKGFDMRRNLTVAWDTAGKYATDLFTNEAVRLINEHDTERPMFLYLAHLAVHKGNENQLLRAPDEEIAKFSYILDPERRIQAAVVSKLDQSVGDVMDALRSRGMLENSIVVFMSDNGAPTNGILSNQGSNYPLRGIKDSPWEGGTRGVAAIWSPLIRKSKRVSNQMMFMSDWLPTLLSAAGVDRIQLGNIDGFDLWPSLVSGKISPRSEIVINIDDLADYAAIRRGDFKYIIGRTETGIAWLGASGDPSEGVSPRYDPYKVLYSKTGVAISGIITAKQAMELNKKKKENIRIVYDTSSKTNFQEKILTSEDIIEMRKKAQIKCNVTEKDKIPCEPMIAPCLFNIEQDPCEMVNLAERNPVILTIFETILIRHRLTVIPPSNLDGDPRSNPSLWNNTWTSWAEPNPLMLAYTNIKQPEYYADQAIVVISIIFCFFVIGAIIAFKCRKTNSNNLGNPEYQNYHERVTCTIDDSEEAFSISSIVPDTRRNDTPRHGDIN
ncbi:arylsulfatase B-like isoform X2 [Bombus huntii]|nr:arylsulfatase B-like isoform X2 [Bombus huntii]